MNVLPAIELARNVSAALDLLRRPEHAFARDFLLAAGDDPQGDMVMLSNPVALNSAVSAHVTGVEIPRTAVAVSSSSGAAAPHLDPAQCAPDAPLRVVYTMIPSFSVGSCTVGIAIQRVGCPITTNGKSQYSMGRFVRDEETAETLIASTALSTACVSETSELGSIIYLRHDTSTRRFHVYASTEPAVSFRRIYSDYEAGDLRALTRHFRFGEAVTQVRVNGCPVCGIAASVDCNCALDLSLPKSALDFSVFKKNHETHLGVFSGASIMSILEPPNPGAQGNAAVCLEKGYPRFVRMTTGTQDADFRAADWSLTSLLHQMAIQDRCQRASPCRAVMPTPVLTDGKSARETLTALCGDFSDKENAQGIWGNNRVGKVEATYGAFLSGATQSVVGRNTPNDEPGHSAVIPMTVDGLPVLSASPSGSASGSDSANDTGLGSDVASGWGSDPVLDSGSASRRASACDPVLDTLNVSLIDPAFDADPVNSDPAAVDFLDYFQVDPGKGVGASDPLFPELPVEKNDAPGEEVLCIESFWNGRVADKPSTGAPPSQNSVGIARRVGSSLPTVAPAQCAPAELLPEEPGKTGHPPGGKSTAAEWVTRDESLAKAIAEAIVDPEHPTEGKKLTRQEKNRLAAARSNQRRREGMQSLKQAVSDAREKVKALQEKEAELRSKNVELKSSAAALWMKERSGAAT